MYKQKFLRMKYAYIENGGTKHVNFITFVQKVLLKRHRLLVSTSYLIVLNLLIWTSIFDVASNVTASIIWGHMVHQGVNQHQATCHLPTLPSQPRSSSHVLQRYNIAVTNQTKGKEQVSQHLTIKVCAIQLCKSTQGMLGPKRM